MILNDLAKEAFNYVVLSPKTDVISNKTKLQNICLEYKSKHMYCISLRLQNQLYNRASSNLVIHVFLTPQ